MSDWDTSGLAAGLDAYTDWAMGAGKPYVSAFDEEGCYIPVLVALNEGCAVGAFQKAVKDELGERDKIGRQCMCLPSWYRQSDGDGAAFHLSALVTEAFFDKLADDKSKLPGMIRQLVIGQRLSKAAVGDHAHDGHDHEHGEAETTAAAPPAATAAEGSGTSSREPVAEDAVVIGVIDDAIGFAHERFRRLDESGQQVSRVEYAWVQDHDLPVSYGSREVPYGRQFKKKDIDDLLKANRPGGIVDEDRLYREAGAIDFSRSGPKALAWRTAHGTHVMDLATGEKPGKADASRPIVCVQLPAAVTADTSGAGLAPYVLDGIWYIIKKADELAARNPARRKLPVVINFSYGFQAGPHDGTHPIELAIDKIVKERRQEAPIAVVLPSGNSHLARCHAEVSFKEKGEDVILDWRIPPDDRTSTFLEIWLPPGTEESRLSVSLAPPGREFGDPLPEGAAEADQALVWKPNGDVLCKLAYELVATSGRGRFLVAVLPTAFHNAPTDLAPHGLWRVKLTNRSLEPDDKVGLWIQRDDTPHGYPTRGRQSFFEGARFCFDGCCRELPYKRFDEQGRVVMEDDGESPVRRAGSINAIATGSQPVVVGGLVRKHDGTDKPLARYSSGGPVTPPASGKGPDRQGPDTVAVCDDTEVHWGVLAAGSRSGSVVAMNGTSVAAPRVARWIAERFAASAAGGASKALAVKTPEGAVHARATGHAQPPGPVPQGSPPPALVREGAGPLRLPPIVPLDRYEP